jgi:hypothetical protein
MIGSDRPVSEGVAENAFMSGGAAALGGLIHDAKAGGGPKPTPKTPVGETAESVVDGPGQPKESAVPKPEAKSSLGKDNAPKGGPTDDEPTVHRMEGDTGGQPQGSPSGAPKKGTNLNDDVQRAAKVKGNDADPSNGLVIGTEQKTIDLRDPKWTETAYTKSKDSIVYILRDADTGQALKVGKSEVSNFEERFDDYVSAQKFTSRNLKVETIAFDSTKVTPEKVESQIRSHLVDQGEKLPWDNTKQRLGRPGPGVPGTRGSKMLRSEGWGWNGEDYVKN